MGPFADRPIPEPTLRRLPLYYHYLSTLAATDTQFVSSLTIGTDLDLDATQVRKDLAVTGIEGKPKIGYEVAILIAVIEEFLGWNNINSAFLAGAGHLGMALLNYPQFKNHGLSIVAAFDIDPRKIGQKVYGKKILPLDRLSNLSNRMGVKLGIITVPAGDAQAVADLMIEGGIKAIWNFAPVSLKVPADVIVRNEELYYSLAALSHRLAQNLNTKKEKGEQSNVNNV
jgi:redox-sensing transcriptional repressor